MTAVVARNITVHLDSRRVLDRVDLVAGAGEWIGIIGPNGAGKTTLLRAISGAVDAEGDRLLDGHDVGRLGRSSLARRMAVVPQRPEVPTGIRVFDYVLLGRAPHLSYLGVEGRDDLSIASAVLQELGLADLADRPLDTLSGGELQRAVLARALAQEAPLLLLDEPIASLDVGHQQQVLDLVEDLRSRRGLTVLSALHDLTLAAQYCDRLVLLAGGRVVAEGSARTVLTEGAIREHYGAEVRILDDGTGGVVVIPTRRMTAPAEPELPDAAATWQRRGGRTSTT